METINQFYQDLLDQIRFEAEVNSVSEDDALTEAILEFIKDANETNSPEVFYVENNIETPKSFGSFKINAFDYSDLTGELDLFVSLFKKSSSIETIQSNAVERSINKLTRFFNLAISGELSKYYRQGRPEIAEFTDMLYEEYKARNIKSIRMFVITDARLREEYGLDDVKLTEQEIDTEYHIWDIENVMRAEQASRQMTEINIPLDTPIECIKVNDGNDKISTYIGIIPAVVLAQVYGKYKDKLIDQNVRNYLGGKIKVNAKIAETLRECPEMFFAYNNGISSIASDVTIKTSEDGSQRLFITELRNWHIVNGGQTTCTIYNVYKKNKETISRAYVAMKVSELRDTETRNEIVQKIAQSANSQTAIKDSDLNANSTYLLNIDKISKSEWTPAQSFRPNKIWYFERLRGQFLSDKLNEGTSGSNKVRKFLEARPKDMLLSKADIAKVMMSWDGFPYEASKGGELCFNAFWKKDYKNTDVTREYFHEIVAKRILYIEIHKLFTEMGHKAYANIVDSYVLATIALKTQQKLDLDYIWRTQNIQPELIESIKECITVMVNYITKIANDGINPSVVAKKLDFWNQIKVQMANVRFSTNASIIKVESEELTPDQEKLLNEMSEFGVENWKRLSEWGRTSRKMSIMEKKRIDHLIVALERSPETIKYQAAESCMRILRMSEEAGFRR